MEIIGGCYYNLGWEEDVMILVEEGVRFIGRIGNFIYFFFIGLILFDVLFSFIIFILGNL